MTKMTDNDHTDIIRLHGLAPAIKRTPIGEPKVSSLNFKPQPIERGWVNVLHQRKRIGRLITFVILISLLSLNYQILYNEGIDSFSIFIYTLLYGIMTWFLFNSFVKTLIGSWAIIKNTNIADHPSHTARDPDKDTKVAIIFPVYHEDVARVAAGIAATVKSLIEYTPQFSHHYDVFLLSDSRKRDYIDAETKAILYLKELFPSVNIYYRWRVLNTHAKIGNLTDFCRRWGAIYKYMFTMDADSIVSGETIHTTLRMMEGRDVVGILQTNPKPVFRKTIFGRMQQFSGNIFGHAFSASLQATMLGNAVYMGHNAMVRVKAFMDHCILPSLSGDSPWGGKPLSHDIVESALMAANGYETWFLPELKGSWEEIPANILASLIRERRWMQGNLQHGRLVGLSSFTSSYKEYFINGIFAYASAPIWAIFLVFSSYLILSFIKSGLLEPETAEIIISYMSIVGVSTLTVFIAMRLISISAVFTKSEASKYGGKINIILSVIVEFIFSVIYSPIVMMAMSKFIYLWLRKKSIIWGVQDRGDNSLTWTDCLRHFGWMSVTGIIVLLVLYWFSTTIPDQDIGLMMAVSHGWLSPYLIIYWMMPVLTGIILAPLIVRLSSQPVAYLEKIGLFLTPEETSIPDEFIFLNKVENHLRETLNDY